MLAEDYLAAIGAAGFADIRWERSSADSVVQAACHDPVLAESISAIDPADVASLSGTIWSYRIEARKP
jgi:hypothetical protein